MNENIRKGGLFRNIEQLKNLKQLEPKADENNIAPNNSGNTVKTPVALQQLREIIGNVVFQNPEQTDSSSLVGTAQEMQAAEGTIPISTNKTPTEELEEFEARIASGEFNSIRPTSDSWNSYIYMYSDLLKADLEFRYNYPEGFVDSIIDMALSSVYIYNPYATDLINPRVFFMRLTDTLNKLKENVEQLQQSPILTSFYVDEEDVKHNRWEEDGVSIHSMFDYINYVGLDLNERYFTHLFLDIFEQLGLSEVEQQAFVNIIFKEIANKIGKPIDDNTRFTLCDLEQLNTNGIGGFLDEIYTIVQEKAKNIAYLVDADWQSATSINYSKLFSSSDSINAEYILNNLGEMLLSSDPGIRRLAHMINDHMKIKDREDKDGNPIYREMNQEEKEEYIKWLIVLINEQNGIQYQKTEGMLFVGTFDIPVTTSEGSLTITVNITEEDNVIGRTEQEAEEYIKAHVQEFVDKWAEENQYQIISLNNFPQINVSPALGEDTDNGIKEYWQGSFYMQVTLEDGTKKYITIPVTLDDKIVAGNRQGIENYIRENIDVYLSRWESANINQFITSWDDLNCAEMHQFRVYEYTKERLDESNLNDYEKSVYFQRMNDGTYLMQIGRIDKQFPNMNIRDIEYLEQALAYAQPTKDNIYLTSSELSELGDNIFDKIEEIMNSQKFENCYKAGINGKIEHFKQGDIGDCWFLSSILALNSTCTGREIIKNSIRWNSDYTGIIVTFAGVGETVEISVEELIQADFDNNSEATYMGDGLSHGDNDILILEMAYKKLKGRINGSASGSAHNANAQDVWDFIFDTSNARTSRSFWKLFLPFCETDKHSCSGFDDVFSGLGGLIGAGDGVMEMDDGTVYNCLNELLAMKKNGTNFAATFSLLASGGHTYTCDTIDGEQFEEKISGHTIAITYITETTITFTDTNCKSYTVTWENFVNMGIARIEWAEFPCWASVNQDNAELIQ